MSVRLRWQSGALNMAHKTGNGKSSISTFHFLCKRYKKGEKITRDNVRIIRPGYGLVPKYYNEIMGQKALQDIRRGTPLQFDMIGN